ncbi:MAG TPA: PAS domain-containing protein [Coleofasciculaceae cyanobacterium]
MDISHQIEAVYQRALLLRHYTLNAPTQEGLLEKALKELYLVLEELQTSQEELYQQNQELKDSQQAIDLERQRYQALFELAPNGYLVTDLQGKICQANRYATTRLFCAPQAYLINKPLLVFIHEPDRPLFQAQLAHLTPDQPWEVTLNPCKGALISVEMTVTRIKDVQNRGDRLLWSLHHITLHKHIKRQLQHAPDPQELQVAGCTAELELSHEQLR